MSDRTLTIAAIVAVALALICAAATPQHGQAAIRCAESDPCWTWSTMGNLERGVVVIDDAPRMGRPITLREPNRIAVTPCEFAYLAHEGYIQWRYKGARRGSFTRHLRGDGFAMRHGCDYRLYG